MVGSFKNGDLASMDSIVAVKCLTPVTGEMQRRGCFSDASVVAGGPGLIKERNNRFPPADTRSGPCTSWCPCQALPERAPGFHRPAGEPLR